MGKDNNENDDKDKNKDFSDVKTSLLEKLAVGFIVGGGAAALVYSIYDFVRSFYER
jgi:hypothetical protein